LLRRRRRVVVDALRNLDAVYASLHPCMDLRHSKRIFALSALAGYLFIVGLLFLFRAPVEIVLGVSVLLAVSTFRLIRGWPPRPARPRFGPKGTRRFGVIFASAIVLLSVLIAYDWNGNPPRFLPNAGGLILSGGVVGFIVLVASWSASRPSRTCPECGGRIPTYGHILECPYCGHVLT